MPPHMHFVLPIRSSLSSVASTRPIAPFLLPCLNQTRSVSILSSLSDNASAYKKSKRRGRGPSSGLGKTSGRGHKGQKQHGKVPRGFNGGQTPLEVVHGLPKGFKNVHSEDIQIVCLPKIQSWVAQGRISAEHPITVRELIQSRCVHNVKDGIKLVLESKSFPSETPLTQPLHIVVSRASSSAIAAIEAAGGTVTTRYYTETAIKRILRGTMDPMMSLQAPEIMSKAAAGVATTTFRTAVSEKAESTDNSARDSLTTPSEPAGPWSDPAIPSPAKKFLHRLPDPTSRKDIEYYRDGSHRGYLSHLVPEGQGPSLFFKTPGTGVTKKRAESKGKKVIAGENRLW